MDPVAVMDLKKKYGMVPVRQSNGKLITLMCAKLA